MPFPVIPATVSGSSQLAPMSMYPKPWVDGLVFKPSWEHSGFEPLQDAPDSSGIIPAPILESAILETVCVHRSSIKAKVRAEEIAWSVQCLMYNRDDLRSIPRTYV